MATDGNKIASYMMDAASKFRSEGRKAVYAIIATAWAISFTDGKFTPINNTIWSLVFALFYLFLDLLYLFISSSLYKWLLSKFFEPVKDGDFQYNDENKEESVEKITRIWNHIGYACALVMSISLLVSFIFMLLVVLSLRTNNVCV